MLCLSLTLSLSPPPSLPLFVALSLHPCLYLSPPLHHSIPASISLCISLAFQIISAPLHTLTHVLAPLALLMVTVLARRGASLVYGHGASSVTIALLIGRCVA